MSPSVTVPFLRSLLSLPQFVIFDVLLLVPINFKSMEVTFFGLISDRVSLCPGSCYEDLPASAPLSAGTKGVHDHSCPGHVGS